MKENDTSVFKGHRERMREKLRSFGTRYFETYELLEMLLYSVVPRKNTHPTAKLLLKEFPTLDALFSAKCEALTKVSGVGAECAKFISDVGVFLNFEEHKSKTRVRKNFSSYEDVGEFFAAYFKAKNENETVILLLDANLGYIDLLKIYPLDFSSGAVQAKPFIDAALKRGASVCAIAHNHPHSSPFPTDGDWETGKLLKEAFQEAGILLLETYVVTEEGYKRFSSDKMQMLKNDKIFEFQIEPEDNEAFSCLPAILKRSSKNHEEILSNIKKSFSSKSELFESDIQGLTSLTKSKNTSELIAIIAALASRKRTEGFKFGKKHSEEEIKSLLTGYYLNASRESVLIIPLDKDEKPLGLQVLSEGAVNATGLIPRAILEKLNTYNSCSFIMAHNHPGGAPEASYDDIDASASLFESLKSCGVRLCAHYVVARGECRKIDFFGEINENL